MTYTTQAQIIASVPAEITADEAYAQLESVYGSNLATMPEDVTLEVISVLSTTANYDLNLGDLGSDTTLIEPKHQKVFCIVEPVRDKSEKLTLLRLLAEFV